MHRPLPAGHFDFVLGRAQERKVVAHLGVGMVAAIFLDATVVRMVLVPALMELFGRANG